MNSQSDCAWIANIMHNRRRRRLSIKNEVAQTIEAEIACSNCNSFKENCAIISSTQAIDFDVATHKRRRENFSLDKLRFWMTFCCDAAATRAMLVDYRKLAGWSSAWRRWRLRWGQKTQSSTPSRPQPDQADLRLWLTFTKWHQMSSNTRC